MFTSLSFNTFPSGSTSSRRYRVNSPLMLPESTLGCECSPTDRTRERLLPRVLSLVRPQITLTLETQLAVAALELWLFVFPYVFDQITIGSQVLATVLALVFVIFNCGMCRPLVPLQFGNSVKSFIADGAFGIVPDALVQVLDVVSQTVSARKPFTTSITVVWVEGVVIVAATPSFAQVHFLEPNSIEKLNSIFTKN